MTPWDQLCRAPFLGNFWYSSLTFVPPALAVNNSQSHGHSQAPADNPHGKVGGRGGGGGDPTHTFRNAEAAFQACKFWPRAGQFEKLSGEGAFRLKRSQGFRGHEDFTYGGFVPAPGQLGDGANWLAMRAVLAAKFQPPPPAGDAPTSGGEEAPDDPSQVLGRALLATGDAFLLEHNETSGRDATWSDDGDGSGANWLGAQLMLRRDELRTAEGTRNDAANEGRGAREEAAAAEESPASFCSSSSSSSSSSNASPMLAAPSLLLPWSDFINECFDVATGRFWDAAAEVRWRHAVRTATDALLQKLPSSASALGKGNGGGKGRRKGKGGGHGRGKRQGREY